MFVDNSVSHSVGIIPTFYRHLSLDAKWINGTAFSKFFAFLVLIDAGVTFIVLLRAVLRGEKHLNVFLMLIVEPPQPPQPTPIESTTMP